MLERREAPARSGLPTTAAVLRGGQVALERMTRAAEVACGPRVAWAGPLDLPPPASPEAGLRGLARATGAPPDVAGVLDAVVQLLGASQEGWQEGHVRRIMAAAEALAVAAGLCPDQVRAVRWGAALHDIGKARVPQAILQKPGPLDPQEYGEILRHPEWGVELLASLPFLPAQTVAAVRHHHERWDGRGYPAGLRRCGIPLSARIVALADVHDALISARPYKPAWAPADAARHLLRGAGGQFDPGLTRVFVRDVLGFGHLTDARPSPAH